MQTINTHSEALQTEQLEDMDWACSVLAGRGDPDDSPSIAAAMLQTLAEHGATELVRRAAAGAMGSAFSRDSSSLH